MGIENEIIDLRPDIFQMAWHATIFDFFIKNYSLIVIYFQRASDMIYRNILA